MPELTHEVTVKKLPDGAPQAVTKLDLQGLCLWLGLPPAGQAAFKMGDLVEVQDVAGIYMGTVVGLRPPDTLMIGIEHYLERHSLQYIADVWQHQAARS